MADEQAEVMQLQEMVALDWAARLRHLEDLHPRVNALENAVAGIHKDLHDLAANQKENHRETQQTLKEYLKDNQERMDKNEELTRGALDGLGKNVSGLSRKVWFFAGAVWVLVGLGAAAFAMRKELFSAAITLAGSPVE